MEGNPRGVNMVYARYTKVLLLCVFLSSGCNPPTLGKPLVATDNDTGGGQTSTTLEVTVENKTTHPSTGVGHTMGFVIDARVV